MPFLSFKGGIYFTIVAVMLFLTRIFIGKVANQKEEVMDAQPDEEGYINIDQDEIVSYIMKEAQKDGMGPFEADDVFFVVQGEMEYGNSLGQVD